MQTIDLMHPNTVFYNGTRFTDMRITHAKTGFEVSVMTSSSEERMPLMCREDIIFQYTEDLYGQPLDEVENIKYADWWDFVKKGVYRINFHDR